MDDTSVRAPRNRFAYNIVTVLRKTLTILSLIGLLLSAGLYFLPGGTAIGHVDADGYAIFIVDGAICHPFGGRATPQFFEGERGFWIRTTLIPAADDIKLPLVVPMTLFGACFFCLALPFRRKLGLCVKCGYNLKGLTEPRCPECSTSFEERLLEIDA